MLLLSPTVIYALAAPSTPDEVRDEVLERAAKGEKVTSADVQELKKKLAKKDDQVRDLKSKVDSADCEARRHFADLQKRESQVTGLQDKLARPGGVASA